MKARKGMTLVEVVVAMMLLTLIAAPVMMLTLQSSKNTLYARDKTLAVCTAQLKMEELLNTDVGPGEPRHDYQGFEVEVLSQAVAGAPGLQNITVNVYRKNGGGLLAAFTNVISRA